MIIETNNLKWRKIKKNCVLYEDDKRSSGKVKFSTESEHYQKRNLKGELEVKKGVPEFQCWDMKYQRAYLPHK